MTPRLARHRSSSSAIRSGATSFHCGSEHRRTQDSAERVSVLASSASPKSASKALDRRLVLRSLRAADDAGAGVLVRIRSGQHPRAARYAVAGRAGTSETRHVVRAGVQASLAVLGAQLLKTPPERSDHRAGGAASALAIAVRHAVLSAARRLDARRRRRAGAARGVRERRERAARARQPAIRRDRGAACARRGPRPVCCCGNCSPAASSSACSAARSAC